MNVSLIIDTNKDARPNFVEHLKIIEIIEEHKNKNPDISIESCKSLIEGIAKSVLLHLDQSESISTLNKLESPPLFRRMLNILSDYNPNFEVDFTNRTCAVIDRLSAIRNKRGDISHGKSYPKEEESNNELADFIIQTTDALLTYILISFYAIDSIPKPQIPYEENPEFNTFLDEENAVVGIIYSRALYDQDYVQYKQSLLDYNSLKEENGTV